MPSPSRSIAPRSSVRASNRESVEFATEYKIPIALLLAGLAIIVLYVMIVLGPSAAQDILMLRLVSLAIMVPLGIVACYITAKLLSIEFGELRSASVKLAAIFTFPDAIALIIPWGFVDWLVSVVLYLGLLTWLFELDGWEPIILAIVIFMVRVAVGVILLSVMSGA